MLTGDLYLSSDYEKVRFSVINNDKSVFNCFKKQVIINWWNKTDTQLVSTWSAKGRGMELSALTSFNGRLLAVDDRTGIVYSIQDGANMVPWVILTDGDGNKAKGFKGEWSTVKGDKLIVGGIGKEWTTRDGNTIISHDPMWIKEISCDGGVKHVDWRNSYIRVRESLNISLPGYMIHEVRLKMAMVFS